MSENKPTRLDLPLGFSSAADPWSFLHLHLDLSLLDDSRIAAGLTHRGPWATDHRSLSTCSKSRNWDCRNYPLGFLQPLLLIPPRKLFRLNVRLTHGDLSLNTPSFPRRLVLDSLQLRSYIPSFSKKKGKFGFFFRYEAIISLHEFIYFLIVHFIIMFVRNFVEKYQIVFKG